MTAFEITDVDEDNFSVEIGFESERTMAAAFEKDGGVLPKVLEARTFDGCDQSVAVVSSIERHAMLEGPVDLYKRYVFDVEGDGAARTILDDQSTEAKALVPLGDIVAEICADR